MTLSKWSHRSAKTKQKCCILPFYARPVVVKKYDVPKETHNTHALLCFKSLSFFRSPKQHCRVNKWTKSIKSF